jgi:AraC-like DNA-binding protein
MKSYSIPVRKINDDDAFKELALETGGELEEVNTLIRFSGNIDLYYEKVKEAETILLSYIQKSPPRTCIIAKMVALSESTLKRYFKLIYGKSIYEYYLNKKMEMARTLLLENPFTVNEAAERMGYEKVSHFIEIFKKHHGCSPGSIKKKQFEVASSE